MPKPQIGPDHEHVEMLTRAGHERIDHGAAAEGHTHDLHHRLPSVEEFHWDASSFDSFTQVSGSGTHEVVQDGDHGGNVLRCTGMVWAVWDFIIPYDPRAAYIGYVTVRQYVEPTSGGRSVYAGFNGVAADGQTLVNASGADTHSSQHYRIASGYGPPTDGSWAQVEGRWRGRSDLSPNTPATAHADVRYFRPMFLVNYNAGNGIADIDSLTIFKIPSALATSAGF